MPESVFNALSQTWVSGRQLRLSRDSQPASRAGGKPPFRKAAPAGERPFQGKPFKKKKPKKAAASE